jgi:succinyl-CoA synthetase alpha subunit
VSQLGAAGLGQSTVVGLGSDPVGGLTHIDVLKMFNDDPDTDAVLMVGEIGGDAEEQCAHWVHEHMRKPVIGFIAGVTAPAGRGSVTANAKLSVLAQCGIRVARHPGDVGTLLARVASPECLSLD